MKSKTFLRLSPDQQRSFSDQHNQERASHRHWETLNCRSLPEEWDLPAKDQVDPLASLLRREDETLLDDFCARHQGVIEAYKATPPSRKRQRRRLFRQLLWALRREQLISLARFHTLLRQGIRARRCLATVPIG